MLGNQIFHHIFFDSKNVYEVMPDILYIGIDIIYTRWKKVRLSYTIGLVLLVVPVLLAAAAYAWGQDHPDKCQPCHGPINYVTDMGQSFWDHNITSGATVWNNCIQCHTNYVIGTVHENIGCKCHAVMHVGWGNETNYPDFFGGIFYWEVSGVTGVFAPPTVNLVAGSIEFTSANYTNAGLTANMIPPGGMEIEVGVWDPFNNKFLPTAPAGTVSDQSYKVCFGCHFLAYDPSQVGAYAVVDGKLKIGIPEFALKLPPHEIYSVEAPEMSTTPSGIPFQVVAASLAALFGMLVLVVGIRRS